ncbi:Lnb N-terminal periplasmic domain-containing protein [Pontibacter sp. HJ8]
MKLYLKKLSLLLVLCLFALQGRAQFEGYQLSPAAKISLITCSSGDELYAIFGHSAVRVNDPASGLDIVFNYGTFDFNEPGFYLKFIRGKLNYKLSVAYFQDFAYSYTQDNRSVYEQQLNLTDAQREQYWQFLTHNYLPENRFYLYDFFFDNCATRIRDGIEATFPDKVQFHMAHMDKNLSFRNLIDLYLPPQPWSDFGIDLALGAPIDRTATPYEYMFLPDYLSQGFATATIEQDGTAAPLVGERQVIFQNTPSTASGAFALSPVVFGWLLFFVALLITVLDFKRNKRSRTFDVFFFLITGLLGILLFLLWTATDHQAAANNFNLLWALPTHVLAAVYLGRSRLPGWLPTYMLVTAVLAGILLLLWFVWPQQLHTAVFPIALALGLRAAYTVWASKTTVPSTTNQKIKEKI